MSPVRTTRSASRPPAVRSYCAAHPGASPFGSGGTVGVAVGEGAGDAVGDSEGAVDGDSLASATLPVGDADSVGDADAAVGPGDCWFAAF